MTEGIGTMAAHAATAARAAIVLAPIAYHWSAARRRDFYARIADEAPVDVVCIGEVICSKRAPFFEDELTAIADRLKRAGKRVVHATLAEVVLKREREATLALCALDCAEIEINDATGLWAVSGRPHRLGPFLNVYNEETLAHLAARGATHVSLPPEMPRAAVAVLAERARALGVGVEAQVFGRAGLAISARCYHARAHGRTKDNCQFVCEEDPDGMPLAGLDGRDFLIVNGVQTQSRAYVSLIEDLDDVVAAGVDHLRLWPQDCDMVAVSALFRRRLDGAIDPHEAGRALAALTPGVDSANGFWRGAPGWRRVA